MMRFETGSWIHSHTGKYDLSQSGMYGRISLDKYFDVKSLVSEEDLKDSIASINDCNKSQVVITHGATEASFTSLYHIYETGIKDSKTNLPEYEPLYKLPLQMGFSNEDFGLFITSNPNNPTGALIQLPDSYSAYLIDETYSVNIPLRASMASASFLLGAMMYPTRRSSPPKNLVNVLVR